MCRNESKIYTEMSPNYLPKWVQNMCQNKFKISDEKSILSLKFVTETNVEKIAPIC